MNLGVVTVTQKGALKGKMIVKELGGTLYTLEKYKVDNGIPMTNGFRKTVEEIFNKFDILLFIMASGIVVRTIAPLIKGKDVDPGVLVLDENGNFLSSLLSGHLGGANDATEKIARLIDAVPVISTASDVSGKIAVDTIAMKIDGKLNSLETAKKVTSLIVADKKVELKVPNNITQDNPSGVIIVSNRKNIEVTKIIPKNLVIGIGCRKDTQYEVIKRCLFNLFEKYNLEIQGIRIFATIDLKANEPGILKLLEEVKRELIIVPREEIKKIEDDFITSEFVRSTIGIGAVSGPAAKIAGRENGRFIVEKYTEKDAGVTLSIYEEETRN